MNNETKKRLSERHSVDREFTREKYLNYLYNQIERGEKPMGRSANKEGYILVEKYIPEENRTIWEFVKDKFYCPPEGSFQNPIQFTEGMEIEIGKWYYLDDVQLPKESIKNGVPKSFDDTDYLM